jgi:class 3 adenylate cyclase/tetratricopeptide (TPR) repeat protein
MTFLTLVEKAAEALQASQRISLRALRREFSLDDELLTDLVDELVNVRRIARQEGDVLALEDTEIAPAKPAVPDRVPAEYTPRHLADRILKSRAALAGERKQVTVLFADVVGSLDIAGRLDPEEWHRVLDRFFKVLTEGVHRFEGTVNQYTGDGIMALFGAPLALEDHAQRACYAALALRDPLRDLNDQVRREHGLNFVVRMGINSGEVIVGAIGDDLRMDYTAQGHTVGLAQRMEQLAPADSACLSEHTARFVADQFDLRDLGRFELKGVGGETGVYELIGVDAQRTRAQTPFVGRRSELATLSAAMDRALAGGGQVFGVVAEAGTGKSRLCGQFVEQCRQDGLTVYEAHCPSHGVSVPLLPILELLRDYFGIHTEDSAQAAREKIAGRLILLDPQFSEMLPLLFDFLGVTDPEDPLPEMHTEVKQRRMYEFMRRLIQLHAAREPLVIFVDDLHWIDPASDRFMAELVSSVADTRTFLLINFRPEYSAEWTHRSYYQQLPLVPLGLHEVAEIVGNLLGRDASLQGVAEKIFERTRGNPFFTEEVVQDLVESPNLVSTSDGYRLVGSIDALDVPATVQAVLQARIDRLSELEKQALQSASVIGKDFSEALLTAISEISEDNLRGALAELLRSEFLLQRSVFPAASYSFKHPLTHQVAYESQLRDNRRATHLTVAEILQSQIHGEPGESAALIAHHLEHADAKSAAAHWLAIAAEWSESHDLPSSFAHHRRIIDLLADCLDDPEDRARVFKAYEDFTTLGWRVHGDGEALKAAADEGVALAKQYEDRTAAARILAGASVSAMVMDGEYAAALEMARQAEELVGNLDELPLMHNLQLIHYMVLIHCGRFDVALNELEDLVASIPRTGPHAFPIHDQFHTDDVPHLRLWTRMQIGELEESRHLSDAAEEIMRGRSDPELLGQISLSRAISCFLSGRSHRLSDLVEETQRLRDRLGNPNFEMVLDTARGISALLEGRPEQAIIILGECVERFPRSNTSGWARAALAAAHLARDDAHSSLVVADDLYRLARSRASDNELCLGTLAQARAQLALGSPEHLEAAERALDECDEAIASTGAMTFAPQATEARGLLAQARGDEPDANSLRQRAIDEYRKVGAIGHAERLESAG